MARKSKIREIADKATASLRRETYRCLLSLRKLSAADLESDTAIQAQLEKYFLGAGLDTTRSWKELYTRVFRAGANQGLETLRGRAVRKDISTSMTFDAVNPNVVAAIQQNMLSLITSITTDTRNAIRFAVTTGAQGQLTVSQQAVAIRPVLGLTGPQARALANYRANLETGNYRQTLQNALRDKRYDQRTLRALKEGTRLTRAQIDTMVQRYGERLLKHRSEVIARTETLRAANAGQIETWCQAQAQGLLPDSMRMRWLVATDERVCQNCPRIPGMNPADGVPVGQSFQTPYGMVSAPPAHVMCVVGSTQILAPEISAVSKRSYHGRMIVICTTGGKHLACTPNHPVLTPSGWVAAGLLNKGSYVICARDSERMLSGVAADNENAPSTIQEVSEAFGRSLHVLRSEVPTSSPDFHGDGEGSDIAVILSNSLLRNAFDSTLDQFGEKQRFVLRHDIADATRLHGASTPLQLLQGMSLANSGGVRSHAVAPVLFGRSTLHHQAIRHGLVSDRNRIFQQSESNSVARDVELVSKSIFRGSVLVELDQVSSIEIFSSVHTDVFNAETGGWYTANGIITHNCRCTIGLL